MDATNSIRIRAEASALSSMAWESRDLFWAGRQISQEEFLLEAPVTIATKVLRFQVEQVPEIPNDIRTVANGPPSSETIGVLDRENKRILISQKFGLERTRYNLGHELGHVVLHQELVHHRETTTWAGTEPRAVRSPEEREADLFGAELLMPSNHLKQQFLARFGGVVRGNDRDEALLYWLCKDGKQINKERFFSDCNYRATAFATARRFHKTFQRSLCQLFRVYPKPMAIQLKDLGLVK